MLNYEELMKAADVVEKAKKDFYEIKEPWNKRAKEIAAYFQEKKYVPKLIESKPDKYSFETKKSYYFFGKYMLGCSCYIGNEYVEIKGIDYDNDLVGYVKLSVDDFLREDYKEYFDDLVNKWKEKEIKKEEEDKERKEREMYEQLKRKFG